MEHPQQLVSVPRTEICGRGRALRARAQELVQYSQALRELSAVLIREADAVQARARRAAEDARPDASESRRPDEGSLR
jgi:hypothetical protein